MVTTEELYLTEYTTSSSEHSIYSHTNQAEKIVDILYSYFLRELKLSYVDPIFPV